MHYTVKLHKDVDKFLVSHPDIKKSLWTRIFWLHFCKEENFEVRKIDTL